MTIKAFGNGKRNFRTLSIALFQLQKVNKNEIPNSIVTKANQVCSEIVKITMPFFKGSHLSKAIWNLIGKVLGFCEKHP